MVIIKKTLLYSLFGLFCALIFGIMGGAVLAQGDMGNVQFGEDSAQSGSMGDQDAGGGKLSGADVGINLSSDCVSGVGKGCFNYDKLIRGNNSQISEKNKNRTVMTIIQDIIFAATYAVGTVLIIVILYCGLMIIFAATSEKKSKDTYVKGLRDAAIGALLVWGAYAIVRLIQYIAKG